VREVGCVRLLRATEILRQGKDGEEEPLGGSEGDFEGFGCQ
jgi:hypothetical protein